MWLLIFQPNIKIFDASKNRCAFVASVQMRISLKFEVLISMLECVYIMIIDERPPWTCHYPLWQLLKFEAYCRLNTFINEFQYTYSSLSFHFTFYVLFLSLLRYVIEVLNINIVFHYFIICYIMKCNITKHSMAFALNSEYKISFCN